MLQRISTICIVVALLLTIVCLCRPLAVFHVPELGGYMVMNNYGVVEPMSKGADFSVWPMFAILLLTCLIAFFAVILYKNRILQARLCLVNIVLILFWTAICAFYVYEYQTKDVVCHLEMALSAYLPCISLIHYVLARKALIKDESRQGISFKSRQG